MRHFNFTNSSYGLHGGFSPILNLKLNCLFLDLKDHPYFNGIDWEMVAARQSEPPYEPNEFHFELGDSVDLEAELEIQPTEELEPSVAEKFKSMFKNKF